MKRSHCRHGSVLSVLGEASRHWYGTQANTELGRTRTHLSEHFWRAGQGMGKAAKARNYAQNLLRLKVYGVRLGGFA